MWSRWSSDSPPDPFGEEGLGHLGPIVTAVGVEDVREDVRLTVVRNWESRDGRCGGGRSQGVAVRGPEVGASVSQGRGVRRGGGWQRTQPRTQPTQDPVPGPGTDGEGEGHGPGGVRGAAVTTTGAVRGASAADPGIARTEGRATT